MKTPAIFGLDTTRLQSRALNTKVCGFAVATMSDDERLAVIGYLLEKIDLWRNMNCKRDDCAAALRTMMGMPK
jgi:hypothetical protein